MAAGDEDRVEHNVDPNVDQNIAGDEAFADRADDQEPVLDEDQLEFADDEGNLPWLETDDGIEEYESADTGRMIGFVLLGLVALAAIVGGIWWATHRTPDPELVADGSTVAAPATPYKEAPKNPGGKTFDGTGDSSFAVSEGQVRPARLGQGDASAKPSLGVDPSSPTGMGATRNTSAAAGAATSAAASATAAKAANASAPKAAPSQPAASAPAVAAAAGTAVQVGAYSTRASADAAWARLSQQYSALSGVRHRVVEGQADIGTVFRLQALPGDGAAAGALCGRLKSAGLACQVK
jgi:hypothetical protein